MMTDVLTDKQRSFNMSRVRSKNTRPEIAVRSLVHRLGYRFRLHSRDLPGCPDIVFACRKKVIFVHGCFWHRHTCKKGRSLPSTRQPFWQDKLEGNAERDRRTKAKLRRDGWGSLVIWECQVDRVEWLTKRITAFLEG